MSTNNENAQAKCCNVDVVAGGDKGNVLSGRKRGRSKDDEEEISEHPPAFPPPAPALLPRPEQELSSNDDFDSEQESSSDVDVDVDVGVSSATPKEETSQSRPQPKEMLKPMAMPPSDKLKFEAADDRYKEDNHSILSAHVRLVEMRSKFSQAKSELKKAQIDYDKAIALSTEHSEQDADSLLIVSTEWNSRYLQMKSHFDREGHSRIKRNVAQTGADGMSKEKASEFRALSRWASRQRKLKRNGNLARHKVLLLDRLDFSWDPKTGCGSDKWLANYELLKEFKREHKHVDVPTQYGEDKLGLWVKNQLNLYRNGKEGKLPTLSAERIGMLEELGITWGERRKGIPWEDRYQMLLDYKKRFGHVNVPWQWKEDVPLAQWVNTQRKKYKDQKNGKKNNLTTAQIDLLDSISFKWSMGGKGQYTTETAPTKKEESSDVKAPSSNAASFTVLPKPEVAGVPVANASSLAATLLPKDSSGAEAGISNPSMMVTDLKMTCTGTTVQNQHNTVANNHNSMTQNTLSNLFGGNPTNSALVANQHPNGPSGTSLHNELQMLDTYALAQAQALQQLRAAQSDPPCNSNPIINEIGAQQGNAHMLQQLMSNQQQLQQLTQISTGHNGGMNNILQMLQASQNDPSTSSTGYQQLLNQQINLQQPPSGNVAGGSQQVLPQDNNYLSALLQAYQQLQNNKSS